MKIKICLSQKPLGHFNQMLYVSFYFHKNKIYKCDAGHMTKMAAMPIYCKSLQKSSSPEPVDRFPGNFVVCSDDDFWLTLTDFMARPNFVK